MSKRAYLLAGAVGSLTVWCSAAAAGEATRADWTRSTTPTWTAATAPDWRGAATRQAQPVAARPRAASPTPSRVTPSRVTPRPVQAPTRDRPRPTGQGVPVAFQGTPAWLAPAAPPVQLPSASAAAVPVAVAMTETAEQSVSRITVPLPQQQTESRPRLNPTGRQIELLVPVTDGVVQLGETSIILGADDSLRISVESLLRILTPLLDQRALDRLRGQAAGRLDLTAAEWEALGYRLVYDPGRIELRIQIPASDRTSQRIEIADLDRGTVGVFDPPAGVSGFINVRSGLDYVIEGGDTGLTDPNVAINGALRFSGIVLESEANFARRQDGGYALQREGTRFVYDDVARTIRWQIGDVVGQGGNFSSVGDVLGISVFRTYQELAPQRFVRPRGGQEFTLERASNVEAIVNGRSVRRLRLDPGTYQLSDFPFTEGSNDVRLIVEDDSGIRDTLDFNIFFDRTLLQAGLSEFGFTAGTLSTLGDTGPDYGGGAWVASGYIRRGFSDRLTAGLSGQAQEGGQLASVDVLWGGSIGTVSLAAAVSNVDSVGTGLALDLALNRLVPLADGGSQNLGFSLQARSDAFATPGVVSNRQAALSTSFSYSRSFGLFSFGGVDVRYTQGTDGQPDQTSIRGTFGRRIGARGNLSLDFDWRERGDDSEVGARISYTMRLGRNSSIRSEYDTSSERARVSYQRFGGRGVGAFNFNSDIEHGRDSTGANINVGYLANRADLGASFSTSYDNNQSRITDQRASIRFGSALAFADGAFAIGRPINDSFAIVSPHSSLRPAAVVVDRREDGFAARSGLLGGALFPELTAFSERTVTVDSPDAPAGYDLGTGSFRASPPYRSGYRIEVGSDYSLTVLGRLLDRDGQPITLLAGTAIEIGNESRPPVTVFTNREGRFAMIGVRAGRWRIVMPTVPPSTFEIDVVAAPNGIMRIGELEAR
jgi:outer membrane usher protein